MGFIMSAKHLYVVTVWQVAAPGTKGIAFQPGASPAIEVAYQLCSLSAGSPFFEGGASISPVKAKLLIPLQDQRAAKA